MYMRDDQLKRDGIFAKFGVPQHHLFRIMPIYYPQQQQMQMPRCLPHGWSCGQGSSPCCEGLSCFDRNAKRGRYCVTRG